ncbi:MAG: Stp1/IreP family PP2C-type Ser/Thr phosphatase [Prevotellaceae bacterium]|nr:Stp1/IreP family PP2C-type Ser/Thr phosphatase [Prevotellaceae bacterium]
MNNISNISAYCNVAELSDIGCKRKANEDYCGHFECGNGLVSVVCDGMGGHVGGAVASHLAVDSIKEFLCANTFEDPRTAICEAINVANTAILEYTQTHPELRGMGSTCVMLIVKNGKVYIGSVGDSQIYLIRRKTIKQITKDESFVQALVDSGVITKEEAEHHPRKNEITNALGLPDMKPATVRQEAILPEAGDCFLLCSDGLSGMVSDADIEKTVSKQKELSFHQRVEELVEKAKRNGGLDNITVQLVEFSATPQAIKKDSKSKYIKLTALIGSLVAVLAIITVLFLMPKKEEEESKSKGKDIEYVVLGEGIELNIIPGESMIKITNEPSSPTFPTKIQFFEKEDAVPNELDSKECTLPLDSIKVITENITQMLVGSAPYKEVILEIKKGYKEDSLRFTLENSTKIYRFALATPIAEPKTSKVLFTDLGKKEGKGKSTPNKTSQKIDEDNTKDTTENGEDTKNSEKPKAIPDEYTITSKYESGKTFLVISNEEGTNTSDKIFLNGYNLKDASEADYYKIKNNGRTIEFSFNDEKNKLPEKFDITVYTNKDGKEKKFKITVKASKK